MKIKKMKPGDTISILSNVGEELKKLGFGPQICHRFLMRLSGSKQTAYYIWEDKESKQIYVTIDLGVEIPIQCCEKRQEEEPKKDRLKNEFEQIKTQILKIEKGDILILKLPEVVSSEEYEIIRRETKQALRRIGRGDTPIIVGTDFELMVLRSK